MNSKQNFFSKTYYFKLNQLNFGANSLKLYGLRNWNSLLYNVKSPANLKVIKTLIKTEMDFRVVAQYVLTNIQQVLLSFKYSKL